MSRLRQPTILSSIFKIQFRHKLIISMNAYETISAFSHMPHCLSVCSLLFSRPNIFFFFILSLYIIILNGNWCNKDVPWSSWFLYVVWIVFHKEHDRAALLLREKKKHLLKLWCIFICIQHCLFFYLCHLHIEIVCMLELKYSAQ